MQLDLPKGVLLAHNFKVYFSPQPGKYNRLIVHVYTSFFSLFDIHEPVNVSILSGQTDSRQESQRCNWQGVRLHGFSYIL